MLLTFVFACTSNSITLGDTGKSGTDDTSDSQGGGGGGGDTDSAVDTGDTGVEPEALCSNLSGVVQVGTEWVYTYAMGGGGGYSYTKTRTVTDINGGTVRIVEEQVTESGAYTYTTTFDDAYVCDGDGMWIVGQEVDYDYGDAGGGGYSYTFSLKEPALVLPLEAEFGTSWDTVYDGEYTYSNGTTTPYKYTLANVIVGDEPMDVPYGTVDALQVYQEYQYGGGGGGGSGTSVYYGVDLGLVADSQWKLAEYTP